MGEEDTRRQALNVFRMELLGAKVVPVTSGTRTLKDAVDVALGDLVENYENTFYMLGSAVGPDPYPGMVKYFQSVIGREAKEQCLEAEGRLPDYVMACVGGGSNAIGLFAPFFEDKSVKMIGVEPAGRGLDTPDHAATLTLGTTGRITSYNVCYTKLLRFNQQAEKMFACTKVELLGESVLRLVHRDCEQVHALGIEAYLAEHGKTLVEELVTVPVQRLDGSSFRVEMSLALVVEDDYRFYTATRNNFV